MPNSHFPLFMWPRPPPLPSASQAVWFSVVSKLPHSLDPRTRDWPQVCLFGGWVQKKRIKKASSYLSLCFLLSTSWSSFVSKQIEDNDGRFCEKWGREQGTGSKDINVNRLMLCTSWLEKRQKNDGGRDLWTWVVWPGGSRQTLGKYEPVTSKIGLFAMLKVMHD